MPGCILKADPGAAPLKGFQGESFFSTPNPQLGTVITYFLKDDIKTIKEKRKEKEEALIKKGEAVPYPSKDSMLLEDLQEKPYLIFTIQDDAGNIVRKIKQDAKKGIHRLTWDFRYASPGPVTFAVLDPSNPYDVAENGYLALPGEYSVSLSKVIDGTITQLVSAQKFKVMALNSATLAASDKKALDTFCRQVAELRRATASADQYRGEATNKIKFMKSAMVDAPAGLNELVQKIYKLEARLGEVNIALNGNASLAKREFEIVPSINTRIGAIQYSLWNSTAAPTLTSRQSFDVAAKQFNGVLAELNTIQSEIAEVESLLEQYRAPSTPGRIPAWKK